MRISVSSWATTDEDVERSLEAILRIAAEIHPHRVARPKRRYVRLPALAAPLSPAA
jgi:hypothetical protein